MADETIDHVQYFQYSNGVFDGSKFLACSKVNNASLNICWRKSTINASVNSCVIF